MEYLSYFNVPDKLIRLVKACYSNSRASVMVNGNRTEAFDIKGGLRQGCPLSCLLFNLALEWVMRHTPQSPTPLRIGDAVIDRMAYADDVDVCDEDLNNMDATASVFTANGRRVGLQMNTKKTKAMLVTGEGPVEGDMVFSFGEVETVKAFKYLGSITSSDGILETEISARISSASKCAWSLNSIIRSRNISRRTKIQLYTTIIRPILTYGAEAWTVDTYTGYV